MPDKVTYSGTNSQGNHYCNRQSDSGDRGYHYSNTNGSYYYQNTNGSKYYNSGSGYTQYTSPAGSTTQTYSSPSGSSKSGKK
ncbi:hypothetical protein CcaverHIS002_0504000 [Cutaneotrichosporon cavernicola]|uniref:Uncharacterized protein n=1 Tax=Cutaneotrichosporon cavernicola TaxID=279322 RepID=A0AA48L6H5_9TREE|nr:uncharacterized protein CcaverHIS019_0504550 [Cutaneotrichosporon cavernicola]BEI84999.1 hypothetical protein CcaverHIS002_0504000 [Cutaneotrichosporon cavernicola]BEI92827.1 hypothetical protein CcaverHIS019_0504550 [Cutaneotrichosporon cavernicola]BEJ00603.1 hypothetical protein CcaverHIS631_0504600 [Cutaneotrichosporon cavernicola]BEJ08371.1 hypothetical protein CcaverHIS641_0504560 [Cutaneotrichosporon cavernicola]